MLEEATRREQIDMTLLRRIHEHDDQVAREELARRCMPLVRSLARRYAGRGEAMEDLVQAGTVGLVKAIDRYDHASGKRFVSYAVPNITGEIRRHFRDTTWAVHVPRSMQELDAKVQAARTEMTRKLGREPSDDDVAGALGIDVEQVQEAVAAGRCYRTSSLDAPTGEDRDWHELRGVPEPGYAQVEAAAVLDDALGILKGRDRDVVRMRYEDGLLQREIAEKVGVSQMQISRILSGCVAQMAEHVATEPAALAA